VFQSSAWAAHKKDSGWEALRLAGEDGGRRVAAAQFLLKRPGGGPVRLLWLRGGPAGEPAAWAGLLEAAAAAAGGPFYARFCSYREASAEDAALLRGQGWSPTPRPLNRNATFLLDLSAGEAALEAGLSSNWSHNLRRARKRCRPPRLWTNPDPAELARVYRAMEAYKGIAAQHSEEALSSLLRALGPRLALYRVDGDDGAPIALRAMARQGERAWDLLAAAGEAGRRSYATYSLLWELVLHAARDGARAYDLGGADPEAAKGVYDFKKGTGARFVDYLGEWEAARPGLLRLPASWAASRAGAAA